MRAYGTRLVAGVAPGHEGRVIEDLPVFDSVARAVERTGALVSTIFVRGDRVLDAVLESIAAGMRLIHVPAEGVAFRDVATMIAHARRRSVRVVGPNSQGIVLPGRLKIGGSGGDRPERMFRPGPVGVISRSGGMGTEVCWLLTREGIGQSVYVSTGGDLLVGTPLPDVVELLEEDPDTRVIVLFGEAGTSYEEEVAQLRRCGRSRKPLVAFIPGDFLESQPRGTSFGHAGAIIDRLREGPSHKRAALAATGALIARSLSEIPGLVRQALHDGSGAP
jgi:succinyl-CoA synthetase alpha subunit